MGWGDKFEPANDATFTIANVAKTKDWLTHNDDEITAAAKDTLLYGTGFSKDGKHVPAEKIYSNSMPTHDPYTNPNATIYYECGCGAILDPNTKSFAALNNHASEKGWKIRFSEKGYTPYCVKCGESVE